MKRTVTNIVFIALCALTLLACLEWQRRRRGERRANGAGPICKRVWKGTWIR